MPGIDANTVLCLHCDGADASTTFTDSSTVSPKTVTAVGNAQIDTAQSKFGGASALFDGSGDYLTIPDSPDWDFSSGDFTIDFWVRFNSVGDMYYMSVSDNASDIAFEIVNSNFNATLRFTYTTTGSSGTQLAKTFTAATNTWYHMAFVRSGSSFYHFVNGTQIGATGTISGTLWNSSQVLNIGSLQGVYALNGWLDEIRISKGIARWTSNFTPPTVPYDSSTGTVYTDTPSGGLVLGGSTVATRAVDYAVSGGLVLGGSTGATQAIDYTVSAGIVLGGTCTTALLKSYTDTPSGGVVLGGSVALTKTLASTVSGGVVLGGSVATTRTLSLTCTGGLVLGGTAVSTQAGIFTVAPVGGIVLGGSVSMAFLAWLYPVFDLLDGTWTDQAGGHNLWAAIDEPAVDDADYIVSSTSPSPVDICQLRFTPTSDPLSSTGHTLVYRYGSDTDAFVTVTQALSVGQTDAITDYTALSVKFEAAS